MEISALYFQAIKTPFTTLYAYADAKQLVAIGFDPKLKEYPKIDLKSYEVIHKSNTVLLKLEKQLTEYFKGKRTSFELPLKMSGTELQKKAWRELEKIPYGKTLSYLDQAKAMGKTKAVRAVANANGKNHFPLVIPCHRVIRSDGSIGGYAGGTKVKSKLLEFEKEMVLNK